MPKQQKKNRSKDAYVDRRLVVGISSRALFNLDESHQVYEKHGVEAYRTYQIKHENVKLKPGTAFHLVKKSIAFERAHRK